VRLGAGTSASGTVDIGGNAYPAGNASGGGTDVFDFADDNFDHTGLNFIGGANFSVGGYLGGGPANLSTIGGGYGGAVTPANIGSAYKVKLKDMYLVTKQVVGATPFAPDIPTTQKYADLDPHHTDMYGDPLTRLTADWVANNYNGATYIAKSFVLPLLQKLGASDAALSTAVNPGPDPVNPGPANIDWWGHHQRGSMRTGSDPSWSVYNKYMQSWSLENLFASGEICNTFGTYVTAGTHPAGPLSYVAAEGIQKYLAGPGPLV
jgi:gluconate 2-dehydrogenase alpha chain